MVTPSWSSGVQIKKCGVLKYTTHPSVSKNVIAVPKKAPNAGVVWFTGQNPGWYHHFTHLKHPKQPPIAVCTTWKPEILTWKCWQNYFIGINLETICDLAEKFIKLLLLKYILGNFTPLWSWMMSHDGLYRLTTNTLLDLLITNQEAFFMDTQSWLLEVFLLGVGQEQIAIS